MSEKIERTGWVCPRYLDQKWCSNFTVQSEKKKHGDIPVKIIFEELAYVGAFLNNDIPSYAELQEKVKFHKVAKTVKPSPEEVEAFSGKFHEYLEIERWEAYKEENGSGQNAFNYSLPDYRFERLFAEIETVKSQILKANEALKHIKDNAGNLTAARKYAEFYFEEHDDDK